MSGLSNNQKSILLRASRRAVQEVFIRYRRYFTRFFNGGQWLGVTNRYRYDTIKTLKKDLRSQNVNHLHLAEYIAASGPLHCLDGWGFLGRAVETLSRGDANIARHLGYYAELRGAIALLACEGVGVFNNRHYVLDQFGNCVLLDGPRTHQMTWYALEHWAELPRSANLLLEIIAPGGVPLRRWLSEFGLVSSHLIGRKWMKSWGLDLERLSKDREARNVASYRPTHLISQSSLEAMEGLEFICSLWALFRPYDYSRFEVLDRHLLRLSLETAHQAITGHAPADNMADFERRINDMLDRVRPGGLPSSIWLDFLLRSREPNTPILLQEAENEAAIEDPRHHLQVIGRAALLLRVATGACSNLLGRSDISQQDLEFWWKEIGEGLGLWEPGNAPYYLVDLWADVDAALARIFNVNHLPSFAYWHYEYSDEILTLGGCERIALWGLQLREQ